MNRSPIRIVLVLLFLQTASGCIEVRGKHSIMRLWADYNSHQQPALSLEKVYHQPYKASRVQYFRWMYNKPAGKLSGDEQLLLDHQVQDSPQPAVAADDAPSGSDKTASPPKTMEHPSHKDDALLNLLPMAPMEPRKLDSAIEGPTAETPSEIQLLFHPAQNRRNTSVNASAPSGETAFRVPANQRPVGSWLFVKPR